MACEVWGGRRGGGWRVKCGGGVVVACEVWGWGGGGV